MKIGVNGRFLCHPFTGIGQYTRNLFGTLAKQNPHLQILMVVPEAVDVEMPENVEIIVLPEKFHKVYWEQVQLPTFFKNAGVDLVHFPYPSNPWKGFEKPVVVTVHDTIPWTLAAYRKSFLTRLYQDRACNAVKKADHVLTVSETSKHEIEALCETNNVSVIYNAPTIGIGERQKSVLKKYGIVEPYFLYVGGYDKRKNVGTIVQAFQKIAPHFGVKLVLAGGKLFNDSLYSSFDELTKEEKQDSLLVQKGEIIRTGFVDTADLAAIYRSSFAFLNLSEKEGFNLPILEAAVNKTPVIASDIGVHHEVIGDYAQYCSVHDSDGLAELMKKMLTDTNFYQNQKQLLEDYKCPYSWEKSAQQLINLYNKL